MKLPLLVNRFLNERRRRGVSTNTLSAYATDLKQFVEFLVESHGQARGTSAYSAGANTPHREPSAQKTIQPLVNPWLSGAWGEKSFDSLVPNDLSSFRRHLSQSPTNTQARKLTSVREFLRWAHQQGYIADNFDNQISITKRHAVHPVHPLSPVQISRLRREATPLERLLLELILQTGMRLRDVVALRPKHVFHQTIIVPSFGLKIPMSDQLQKALSRYQMIRPAGERVTMLSNAFRRSLSIRTATTILKDLARRAGVRGASARNLRTTFIVRQLEAGVSFPTIQKIVGFQTLGSLSSYQRFNAHRAQESRVTITEV